jgi:hypothetical protein
VDQPVSPVRIPGGWRPQPCGVALWFSYIAWMSGRPAALKAPSPWWSPAYAVGVPLLSSWETAVTSWAGANGLVSMMLFGTPLDAQDSALSPLM